MVKQNGVVLRSIRRLMGLLIFSGIPVMFTACVYDPVYYGPPPHVDFRPHYYDYYYYPSVRVYFQFTSGFYYYHDHQRWVQTRVLPPHIHIDTRDRVRIRIDSDRPYVKHKEHHRIYKPKPKFQADKKRNLKEREANQQWYETYERKQGKRKKKYKSLQGQRVNLTYYVSSENIAGMKLEIMSVVRVKIS